MLNLPLENQYQQAVVAQLVVPPRRDPKLRVMIKAVVAQLVEHQLPKLRVVGSSPIYRSEF